MMKKTLLALSVMAVAGTANASISLYDADGVSVSLSGAAEVQYADLIGGDDPALRIDDGDLAVNTAVAVTQQMDVIAGLAFRFEGSLDSSNVTNDELWVGFAGDFGALTFGRQLLIADDAGNEKDYELGKADFASVAEGDRVVKYVFDNGQFYAGVSALLDGTDSSTTYPSAVDGRLGARFGDLDARIYVYSGDDVGADDFDAWSVEVDYALSAISLAASYTQKDIDNDDTDCITFAVGYTMGATTFQGGYSWIDVDSADDSTNNFYANVTQQMHDNVIVYAEVGVTDEDIDDDFGYLVGMEVKF